MMNTLKPGSRAYYREAYKSALARVANAERTIEQNEASIEKLSNELFERDEQRARRPLARLRAWLKRKEVTK